MVGSDTTVETPGHLEQKTTRKLYIFNKEFEIKKKLYIFNKEFEIKEKVYEFRLDFFILLVVFWHHSQATIDCK